ncbi:hypothetical protein [Telluribacter sp.]|jgi:coenzyme F420-reducing hydrogenase beta subunit|uniref:hypothetical protein n=1 Tax=Telluribacter sp. TaxID=1978767 RepID=UPI002E15A073|nr:hypothetical protein [Telluribacter sp.]
MTGIRYITDEKGHKTDIVINLEEHQELVEDILDALLIEERQQEEKIPLEKLIEEVQKEERYE